MTRTKLILYFLKARSSGYTLLESIMAIVVAGILITSVAPMLALTTAARVQARRVDQATQALRAYVDGVRGGVLPPPGKFVVQDPNVEFKSPTYGFDPATSLVNYVTATDRDPGTLVDTNGNGFSVNDPQDLVIQAIRPISCPPPASPSPVPAARVPSCTRNSPEEIEQARRQGFIMAIRVYRADSFANGQTPSETEQSNVFIGNLGSTARPLVSTFAEVFPNATLGNIRDRDITQYGQTTVSGTP